MSYAVDTAADTTAAVAEQAFSGLRAVCQSSVNVDDPDAVRHWITNIHVLLVCPGIRFRF